MTAPQPGADIEKINAKLEQIEAQSRREWWQTTSSIWEPSREARVIAALRIALKWFKSLTPLQRDNALREIAQALEGNQ
jgi:hypothetical protein